MLPAYILILRVLAPAYLTILLHTYLRTTLPISPSINSSTYQPTYLPAYLPIYLPTYLPTYQIEYLRTSYLNTDLTNRIPACLLPNYLPTYIPTTSLLTYHKLYLVLPGQNFTADAWLGFS